MANPELVKHLHGISSEEIGKGQIPPQSAEEADKTIARELKRLRKRALGKIVDAAQSGDLAAIAWLESRGLVAFPGEYTTAD